MSGRSRHINRSACRELLVMDLNSATSASLSRSAIVGVSCGRQPARLIRRTNHSIRLCSLTLKNIHHVEDACIQESGHHGGTRDLRQSLCRHSTSPVGFRAKSDEEQEPRILSTLAFTVSVSPKFTPRI